MTSTSTNDDLATTLRLILQNQQTFQHTLSVFAAEVSNLIHTVTAFPPISHISFHQRPRVINFTHLCSPRPHLHYQDLNHHSHYLDPIPPRSHHLSHFAAKNSSLRSNHTPLSFTHINTTPLPWVSHIPFIQQSPISNPTYLRHHGYYHEPIHRPKLISLNNDSTPRYFQPTEKGEGEEKTEKEKNNDASVFLAPTVKSQDKIIESQELMAHGGNLSTIAADSVTVQFSVSETEKQSKEITVEAKDKDEAPLQDPPSITQSIPQYFLPSCDSDSIASLSNISGCDSDLGISGSKHCFDFAFLASNPIRSSCLDFEMPAWPATVPSPKKMMVITTSTALPQRVSFVFYPGGTLTVSVRSVRRNHREFQKTVARTVTVAAPPPPRSTFVFDPGGDRDFQSFVFCLDLLQFCSILPSFLNLEWETMHSPWPRPLMWYLPTPSPREVALFQEMLWEPQLGFAWNRCYGPNRMGSGNVMEALGLINFVFTLGHNRTSPLANNINLLK